MSTNSTDKMTPRKRVALTLEHKEPDRVPIDLGSTAANFVTGTYRRLLKHFNLKDELEPIRPMETAAYYDDRLLEKLGSDFRHLYLLPPEGFKAEWSSKGEIVDEWGIKKRKINGRIEMTGHPLSEASIDDLAKYPWPDPFDPGRVKGLSERAEYLWTQTDYAIASRAVSHGFFELAWELRGMENLLVDFIIDKKFAHALLDKTLEVQAGLYTALLDKIDGRVQIVETADDYGTQAGPLMSPELFREFIKPRRTELNRLIKKKAPNAKIFHHTCGSVYAILTDLIDTGIDILNPVQPLAKDMDPAKLKREFGHVLCFHGAIDEQRAIPGSLENLEKEIRTRIRELGPGGGYILASTSNIQDDTPIENILFLVEKAKELGRYPL